MGEMQGLQGEFRIHHKFFADASNTIAPTQGIMKTETKGEKPHGSGFARVMGSGTAGLLELILFHPVDTIAKRLMTNEV